MTKLAKKKKKKKKKATKKAKKKWPVRSFTRKLDTISSGCDHKNSDHDRFGPEECDDCGGVLIRVWVRRD